MRRFIVSAVLFLGMLAIPGCPTAPTTQPSVLTGIVTLAERVALGFAQGTLNAAYASGKVTPSQYGAAEGILIKLSTDLNAGGGTLTQAQIDSLINQALVDAATIYAPITPIGPITPTVGVVAEQAPWTWQATPIAALKRK